MSGEEIRICPKCETKNNPDTNFCINCGFNLDKDNSETFTTSEEFSNTVQENSSQDSSTEENLNDDSNNSLNNKLSDSWNEKSSNGLSKTNKFFV